MNTFLLTNPMIRNLWERFAESKEYRQNFVEAFVKKSIPSQIRAWMKKQGIATQQELAKRSGITQGVVSRAANPKYGDLTLNTIINIGSGFDCVFVGRYVTYSEFCKMVIEDSFAEDADTMLSFEEENKKLSEEQGTQKEEQEVVHAQYEEPKKDAARVVPQAALSLLNTEGFGSQRGQEIDSLEAAPFRPPRGEDQLTETLNAA